MEYGCGRVSVLVMSWNVGVAIMGCDNQGINDKDDDDDSSDQGSLET